MHRSLRLHTSNHHSKGNILVGCLVALGIAAVIAIVGTVFVINSWRGWVSGMTTSGLTAVLEEAPIEESERLEIVTHIETLMTRFEEKEVTIDELGHVVENLLGSPLLPAGIVMGADSLYIAQSEMDDAEKAQARIELARFSKGIFDETIDPNAIQDVIAPIETNTPDENDIVLNFQVSSDGQTTNALRSADEVSIEDLRLLIANAKAKADEAGVAAVPEKIDLSNEVAIAIADALNDDPSNWLPAGVEAPVKKPKEPKADSPDTPDTPDQPVDDGP